MEEFPLLYIHERQHLSGCKDIQNSLSDFFIRSINHQFCKLIEITFLLQVHYFLLRLLDKSRKTCFDNKHEEFLLTPYLALSHSLLKLGITFQ